MRLRPVRIRWCTASRAPSAFFASMEAIPGAVSPSETTRAASGVEPGGQVRRDVDEQGADAGRTGDVVDRFGGLSLRDDVQAHLGLGFAERFEDARHDAAVVGVGAEGRRVLVDDDEVDDAAAALGERAGGEVRFVAQQVDGPPDAVGARARDVAGAGDDAGRGGAGNAGEAPHVFQGRLLCLHGRMLGERALSQIDLATDRYQDRSDPMGLAGTWGGPVASGRIEGGSWRGERCRLRR